jgi:hypothetical protein
VKKLKKLFGVVAQLLILAYYWLFSVNSFLTVTFFASALCRIIGDCFWLLVKGFWSENTFLLNELKRSLNYTLNATFRLGSITTFIVTCHSFSQTEKYMINKIGQFLKNLELNFFD